MAKFFAVSGVMILFIVCGAFTRDLRAATQEQAATPARVHAQKLTPETAAALEETLKTKPDNQAAHEKLIQYYFEAQLNSQDPALEERRQQHVFWLIEHHPESDIAMSPEAGIMPMLSSENREAYEHAKQLWLDQASKHADDPQILIAAGEFVFLYDSKLGQELLEKALLLDPGNAQASTLLGMSYMKERDAAKSPDDKTALAEKALSVRERALNSSNAETRFYELADLANNEFEAGYIAKAAQYASELLRLAPEYTHDWNYGNAILKGHIILGRIALRSGDVAGAKEHLLAAGKTPGSPQLDSFGPNMTLAKELLEKGERDAVLTYLDECAQFWKMAGTKLQDWSATIKSGGTPDFGVNLAY